MRFRACQSQTMGSSFRRVLLLLFLFNAIYADASSTASSSSKRSLDDAQRSHFRRVVSKMIGVDADGVERRGDGRWWSSADVIAGRSRSLPRHIYRLYEQYRGGQVDHGADTVRSVNAQLGSCTADLSRFINLEGFHRVHTVDEPEDYYLPQNC